MSRAEARAARVIHRHVLLTEVREAKCKCGLVVKDVAEWAKHLAEALEHARLIHHNMEQIR